MSSTKSDPRFRNPHTGARSSPPRSRRRDCLPGTERLELQRLSRPKNQQRYGKSSHEDNDSELCMKKLSEFNESLRLQEQSASTKFQWNHLLPDNPGRAMEAASTKPELTIKNNRPATTYSMTPTGIGLTEENQFIDSRPLNLMEMKSGFNNNGEDFRYPEVGNRGMIGEAIGFGGYGENLGFDSSSVISEMARKRIRRTEEVTELAYRKLESVRARASAIDSIVDKIDGAGESRALELDRRISLPQQCMTEQTRELSHGERHQQREDCSHHALTQRYHGFSGEGERVVGFRMNHSPKGALFHGERQRLEELDCGYVLPQLYPDIKAKPHMNENEQENEVLDCCTNRGQSQNGEVFHGECQQFQHYVHFSRKSHDEMEQGNEDFDSRMDCHQSPKRAPLHGENQELSEDYGHSFPQNYVDFGREPHVMEQTNDVFSSRMNRPQGQKMALLKGERLELSGDYGRSLPQHYLDFNVEPDETQQEDELLGSRMTHHPKQKETHSHGEKQQLQEDCGHSLPQHHFGLNGESHLIQQETEVLASRMCYPQDLKEAYFHGESQQLQQDCALESYTLPKQDGDHVCTTEGSTQHISATEELGINSQSSMKHPKKYIIDLRKIRKRRIRTLTQTSDASDDEILDIGYGDGQWSDEKYEQFLLLRNSGFESPQDGRANRFDELPSQRSITDCDYQFFSPHMQEFAQPSDRKSVKQRLGRHCHVHYPNPSQRKSIKQRLGPPCQVHYNRKNVKQRLGPPCQVQNPIAMPRIERHKMRKAVKENVNDFHEGVQAQDMVLPDAKRGRTEPPENSEEFKQLIHGAFVKFVKVLNENPAQRRKYTEKGEAETLKCCVCGSKSKEYVNTLSLVMHAFTSRGVGHRVDHLGLHKALCLLMGWNSMAASKGLWAPNTLPDAEVSAMKEDLVVWPPVVIVHNSSIGTTISDHRIIVSIEELEAFLRDIGFGRAMSKVCRGKPANHSIIIVIFHGTFSGLQEAERLHKLYAEKKHGRGEFQQINCGGGETQKVPLDKVEDVLYGYLGIAGDLDKLDFETKSHSVVKSKKEIYAIEDALLDSE